MVYSYLVKSSDLFANRRILVAEGKVDVTSTFGGGGGRKKKRAPSNKHLAPHQGFFVYFK